MPPRNSKTKPKYSPYNLNRLRDTEESLKEKAAMNRLADQKIQWFGTFGKYYNNKEFLAFEDYKQKQLQTKGTIVDESIYKTEEESDPRYRNSQWYRDRANGVEGGWDDERH